MKYKKLIKYLPPFLRNIAEYKAIFDVEDVEVENLESKIQEIVNEVIVDKASGYGLEQYEKIFNLVNTSNEVEERRFNIKSKMINQLPFNMEWLENKIKTLVGEGNYTISLDRENFVLTIRISHIFPDIQTNLNKTLRQEIPANIVLYVNLFREENSNLYLGANVHIGKLVHINNA